MSSNKVHAETLRTGILRQDRMCPRGLTTYDSTVNKLNPKKSRPHAVPRAGINVMVFDPPCEFQDSHTVNLHNDIATRPMFCFIPSRFRTVCGESEVLDFDRVAPALAWAYPFRIRRVMRSGLQWCRPEKSLLVICIQSAPLKKS